MEEPQQTYKQYVMVLEPADLASEIEAWTELEYPHLDPAYDLTDVHYHMKAGLFGYDIQDRIWDCEGDIECAELYNSYDGWSMGAYMRMDYYDGFTDYVNFGACWEDGNCWGAWLKYENGNYYSTEISFHFDGEFSD